MGHCCCGAHSCTTENKKNASTSIVHEYWKVGLSFILLIGGIIMNALQIMFVKVGVEVELSLIHI